MGRIYATAYLVIIWLGKTAVVNDLVEALYRRICDLGLPDDDALLLENGSVFVFGVLVKSMDHSGGCLGTLSRPLRRIWCL